MSRDDLTRNMGDADAADDTQPTITAVFRLLQDLGSQLNARLDESEARLNARLDERDALLNARLDEIESRLTRDIEGVNKRVTEGFKELGHKIRALNNRALQSEANYEDLFERIERLESKPA